MSRVRIPQRIRIYVGCEGQSEQSYARLLGAIADSAGLHIFIDNDVLQPGGGDPLALVELAVRRIVEKESKRGAFSHRAILLDSDKFGMTPERDRRVAQLAEENGLALIWQRPCHEAFLLRHFDGYEPRRPATSELAMVALRRLWPEYRKGMPAIQLSSRIDLAGIRRASDVEVEFSEFLDRIGFGTALA